jgi:hypothetical protein
MLVAFTFAVLLCVTAFGQTTGAGIRGIITDPNGGAIPGLQVQATHVTTNTNFTTVTNAEGIYHLENLPIGTFQVVVEAKGFQKSVTEVSVLTGTTTSLDIKLALGTSTQVVNVNSTFAPAIQVDNAENATLVETKALLDLPSELGGNFDASASGRRQVTSFLFLTPGVVGNGFNHSTNGAPDLASEVMIDGVPYSQQETPGYIDQSSPPFEGVAEFKNSNSIFPPEYGRGFGVEIYTLKSGTNHWHGDAFEFLRNEIFDARGFFAATRPKVRQNDFGGTVGGPIKKNKLFFFMAWDEIHVAPAAFQTTLDTIPTMAMHNGDFTGLKDTNGNVIPIYDPTTTVADGHGGFTRTQFSCGGTLNVICPAKFSPIAKKMIDLLPAPDYNRYPNNWISRAGSSGTTIDRVPMWKVDYNFNEKNHFNASLWRTWNPGQALNGEFGGTQTTILDRVVPAATGWLGGYRANWDFVASPHVVNHFGFGNETLIGGRGSDPRHGIATIPIPGIDPSIGGFPAFYIGPSGAAGSMPEMGNTDQIDNARIGRYWIINDTVTVLHGRHEFKFGGEIWRQYQWEVDGYSAGSVGGTYNFLSAETSLPDSPNFGNWGNDIASWLVGAGDNAQRQTVSKGNRRDWNLPYFSLYAQDKIQLSPKLLLDIGLRWEVPETFRDNEEGMSAMNPTLPNPAAGGLLGAYVFGNARVIPPLDLREFGPRLGVTYRFNDKTVGRAGYAVNYSAGNGSGLGSRQWGNAFAAGYNPEQTYSSPDSGITPGFSLDKGWSPYPYSVPDLRPGIQVGGLADYYNPGSAKQPQMQTWTLDLQREFSHNILIDAAWIGNHGVHIPAGMENLDQVSATWLGLGSDLNQDISCLTAGGCPNAVAAGVKLPYPGFTGSVAQALRPYPQYTSINDGIQPSGSSWYNALQVKVQKRFSEHLSFLAAYTFSKTLTTGTGGSGYAAFNSAPLDTANRKLEKTLGTYNYPHNLVVNWVYQLPFGEHYSSGVAKGLAHGWEVSGVFKGVSGPVIGIGGGPSMPLFGGGNRPSRVAGVAEKLHSGGGFDPAKSIYLNAAAFTNPAPFTFGNVSPTESSVRGFATWNTDLSLIKRTKVPKLGETGNVEFRAEAFNLFNQVQFSNPDSNWNDTVGFGTVGGQNNAARVIQFGIKINF